MEEKNKTQNNNLNNDINNTGNNEAQLKIENNQLNDEINNIKNEENNGNIQTPNNINALTIENIQFKNENLNTKLINETNQLKIMEINNLIYEINQLKDKENNLQNENIQLKNEILNIKNNEAFFKEEINLLKNEISQLKKFDIANLKNEINILKQKETQLINENILIKKELIIAKKKFNNLCQSKEGNYFEKNETIKEKENLVVNPLNKKYEIISLDDLKDIDFRKDEIKSYTDKQYILSTLLRDFMEKLKKNYLFGFTSIIEINEIFELLKERLIDPIINEDQDINLLKIINEHIGNKNNCLKLFCKSSLYNNHILSYENCEKYMEIFEKLIIIFNNNNSDSNYRNEFEKILKTFSILIESNHFQNKGDKDNFYDVFKNFNENKDKDGIIFLYKLLYKLITKYHVLCKIFILNDIIETLINKLIEHANPIRNIIYDIILYLIKQLDEYNKKNFNLSEEENEGIIYAKLSSVFSEHINKSELALILYNEKPEILKLIYVITSKNNSEVITEIMSFIDQIFSRYENSSEKLYPLLDIISSLIQINDNFTYDRLIQMAGYPSLVVRQIPFVKREDDDEYDEDDEDDNNEEDDKDDKDDNGDENNSYKSNSFDEFVENEEDQKIKTKKQKWPLFGEKLIDGNIYREIYEYIISNHNKSYRCLLAILFPSEYKLLDDNDKIIKISEEKKKEILLDIIKSIFNERNNYPLFKYLFLTPSRSLLHKNLYSEIISYLSIYNNKPPFDLEKMKEKEKKYTEFLKKEVQMVIDLEIKKDKKVDNDNNFELFGNFSDLWENNENNENSYESIYKGMFFECHDINMKLFTGFIADFIPGEIIREEIYGIAKSSNLAMYRIQYYTKNYRTDELRDRLLNPDKYKNVEEKESYSEYTPNEEEIEFKNSEINKELDQKEYVEKYDVSKKNENDFLYNLYKDEKNIFILEDKEKKDRNNVKNFLMRFVFSRVRGDEKKIIEATIKPQSSLKNQSKKNFYLMKVIKDQTKPHQITNFWNMQRFKDELKFVKEDDIMVTIEFDN